MAMDIATSNAMVPENISRIARDKGIKLTFLSSRAGLANDRTIFDILANRRLIRVNEVIAISDALGVPVSKLFEQ